MSDGERTLVLVKPDGVQRGKVGTVVQRLEAKGLKLVGMKLVHASEQHFQQHYIENVANTFYPNQVRYMSSGPVVAMVWQGPGAVAAVRRLMGPVRCPPGTLRFENTMHIMINMVHGSDRPDSAHREIALWFTEDELMPS